MYLLEEAGTKKDINAAQRGLNRRSRKSVHQERSISNIKAKEEWSEWNSRNSTPYVMAVEQWSFVSKSGSAAALEDGYQDYRVSGVRGLGVARCAAVHGGSNCHFLAANSE